MLCFVIVLLISLEKGERRGFGWLCEIELEIVRLAKHYRRSPVWHTQNNADRSVANPSQPDRTYCTATLQEEPSGDLHMYYFTISYSLIMTCFDQLTLLY
jgi:hypothetical protein